MNIRDQWQALAKHESIFDRLRVFSWLLAGALFVGWCVLSWQAFQSSVQQRIETNRVVVDTVGDQIESEFTETAFLTLALAQRLSLLAIEDPTFTSDRFISISETAFERDSSLYQIRIMSLDGQERLRIEKGRGFAPLQNKAGREYLQLPYLAFGQLYLSTLNLNVENGELEQPLRPTYRVAARLSLPAPNQDLVVFLNFNAEPLFQYLPDLPGQRLYIARTNGEWVFHPEANKRFSRQTGQSDSLSDEFPLLDFSDGDLAGGQSARQGWFQYHFYDAIRFDSTLWQTAPEDRQLLILIEHDQAQIRGLAIDIGLWLFLPLMIMLIVLLWVTLKLIDAMERRRSLVEQLRQERNEISEKHNDLIITHNNLKLVQNQLVESQKVAALGMMVSGVAHELNTPVNGAGLSVDSALEDIPELIRLYKLGELTEEKLLSSLNHAEQSLNLAHEHLHSSKNLISRFRMLAKRVDADESYEVDLAKELSVLQRTFNRNNPESLLKLTVHYPDSVRLISHGFMITQVLNNLVENAVAHAFEPGVPGEIEIDVTEEEKSLTIAVSDNGRGISQPDRVFEPFYSTGRGHGHTGLGLHMVYLWVTQTLKGQIRVSSEPEVGTTFTLTLPKNLQSVDL
ncbi:sensor histidine kinase [Reinekea blandensis]|uniref:histidine kinase n=1 Tax=Reinekea blandensis MED297 TaxID=314283 RepID=A4BDU8_9GAMM|nr:HAMP domain-containing sensor histidine kinase [Reinekea blandensis]EAR09707.1 Signal transduction histidine kinase regulating C4-dicarboxylate transport system [Reinekea blandensis MED297]